MKKYKVKIKETKRAETINAKSELEAKVKFCWSEICHTDYFLISWKLN